MPLSPRTILVEGLCKLITTALGMPFAMLPDSASHGVCYLF